MGSDNDTRAFLDISINKEKAGRLVFQLYSSSLPTTCKNFLSLCSTLKFTESTGIHRIIPGFMIQGGEIPGHEEPFKDEAFTYKHDKRGILSMANAGPDTNGSQFFVILDPVYAIDCVN
jgi:cyclophilin family peptidyl-prolyl cis-trans isomerase